MGGMVVQRAPAAGGVNLDHHHHELGPDGDELGHVEAELRAREIHRRDTIEIPRGADHLIHAALGIRDVGPEIIGEQLPHLLEVGRAERGDQAACDIRRGNVAPPYVPSLTNAR
jgi:hypothetical protein